MFYAAKVLFASSLLLMSDRGNFWDTDTIGDSTEEIIDGKETAASFDDLKNQRVLLLVHGYNSTGQGALDHYRTIQKNLDFFNLYDTFIGYFWPGCDAGYEYFKAEKNTDNLAPRLQDHLQTLSQVASSFDVMAHSMGNRLILEALVPATQTQPIVRNFYSLAAAVKDKDIEMGHPFYLSALQCQNVFILHSDHDDVLKYDFFLAEHAEALGYAGLDKASKEPKNVQFIDCTEFVDGHSGYFDALPVFSFVKNQQMGQISSAMNVKLQINGLVSPE